MKKKIKVLQFTCPAGFYGAERWVLALARHLNKEKVTCDLAVTKEPGQGELEIVQKYTAEMGKTYEIITKSRFDFGAVGQLCNLIREQDIDIIHTHGYKSDIIGIIAARRTGIISVSTPHGFENAKDWKLRSYIWLGCQTFRFFTKVAPLSRQLYDDVVRVGVKKENIVYIQNGVDLQEVEEHRDSGEAIERGPEKRIGFIGQLISRKNVFDLLDIFNSLSAKHGNMKLLLLGDGKQRRELEEYANTLPEKDHIEFLGFRDDRLQLLKSFDIFVMTSTLEGIPRCLMETMAMGIPVAAYNIAGIDQLISHEKSGLLAPLGEKDTLASYCEKILFEPEYAKSLAKNARSYVYEAFSAQRMARDYEQLFSKLLSDKLDCNGVQRRQISTDDATSSINVRLATRKDRDRWDKYVEKHPNASPYHLFAWGLAVENTYKHKCCYLIAERDGKVVGVSPLISMSNLFSAGSLCSLPFCDLGSNLYDDDDVKQALMNGIVHIAKEKGVKKIDLRESSNTLLNDGAMSNAEKSEDDKNAKRKVRMLLPLPDSTETLSASFKSKLRSQIKKAEKNGVTYREGRSEQDMVDFYAVFTENMRQLGSPTHARAWFENIVKYYGDNMLISVVSMEDQVVGAAIILFVGNTVTVPWASTLPAYNKYSPNMLLYWNLLKYAAGNGYSQFDFGRSTIGEGTYKFKKQWGAKPMPLAWKNLDGNGDNINLDNSIETASVKSSRVRPIVEKIWRKLPLGITVFIGPILRKHISL